MMKNILRQSSSFSISHFWRNKLRVLFALMNLCTVNKVNIIIRKHAKSFIQEKLRQKVDS